MTKAKGKGKGKAKPSPMSKRLSSLEKKVSNLYKGVEFKRHDVTPNATISEDGRLDWLNVVPLGDELDQRNGTKIAVTGFKIMNNTSIASAATNSFMRYMLVEDTQPRFDEFGGGGPTYAEIADALLENSNSPWSLKRVQANPRFKVLYDNLYGLTTGGNGTKTINKYISLDWRILKFEQNSTEESSVQSGSNFYLLQVSNETTASGNGPVSRSQIRMYYADM